MTVTMLQTGAARARTLTTDVRETSEESREWTTMGRCVGRDPDELFVTGAAQRVAAKVCSGCPVRLQCLSDALDNRVEFGVWGGLTERQRRMLLRNRPDVTNWRALLENSRPGSIEAAAS